MSFKFITIIIIISFSHIYKVEANWDKELNARYEILQKPEDIYPYGNCPKGKWFNAFIFDGVLIFRVNLCKESINNGINTNLINYFHMNSCPSGFKPVDDGFVKIPTSDNSLFQLSACAHAPSSIFNKNISNKNRIRFFKRCPANYMSLAEVVGDKDTNINFCLKK